MKLVLQHPDSHYLHDLVRLLENNGIPATLSGEHTARMIVPRILLEPGLWVCIAGQLEEAKRLIDDPDYEVMNPVDIESFHAMADGIRKDPAYLNRALLHMAGIMLAVMALTGLGVLLMRQL